MASEILEAIRHDLADYLRTYLAENFAKVTVWEDWPTPGQSLGQYAVSVLSTGTPDEEMFPPVVISSTPTAGVNGTVRYSYGRMDGIGLDIDCWASSKPKRNALTKAMEAALNRPPQNTVAGAPFTFKLGKRSGLVLRLPSLFDSLCRYRFSEVPSPMEDSRTAQTNEWRSHFRGTAELTLITEETYPLIKRIRIKENIGGASDEDFVP